MVSRRSVVFTLLVCFLWVSPCLAEQDESSVNAAVKALVEQHNEALGAQDLKGVMETYASAQNIILIGTLSSDIYVGGEAVSGAYAQLFKKITAKTLSFKYNWVSVGSRGDVAWFAVTINIHIEDMLTNEKSERNYNMSGIMEKVKGKWVFVSTHFSTCDQPSVCMLPLP